MKRSVEIQNAIVDKKNQMADLKAKGDIEGAYALVAEINALRQELEVENALNEPELPFSDLGDDVKAGIQDKKAAAVKALNKAIRGKGLTEAEAALIESNDESGGYLVPEEISTEIDELKRSLNSLKELCHIIPVTTKSGQNTVETESDGKLLDFDEMGEIEEGDITFSRVPWSIKDKGLLMPISNQLIRDEKANLMSYINRDFAKRAVRTENADILTVLKKAEVLDASDYKGINKALNVKLDSAIADNAVILTNQTGFDYLDTLEDANGRPLLVPDIAEPTVLRYRGHRIVKVNDNEYTTDEGTMEFFVGDIASFVDFEDRQGYEIAMSEHAGFKTYSTLLRCVERYGVSVRDEKAGIRVVISVNTETTATETTGTTKTDK